MGLWSQELESKELWSEELSSAFGSRVTFSLRGQRKSNQRERPPRLALAGLLSGKSVSRGRAFRQHIHVLAKRHRHPADARCAACRPRLTAAQGPRVEQRAILARTIQKSQSNSNSLRVLQALQKWMAMQKLVLMVCFRLRIQLIDATH